jgi:hypothetical protein
MLRCPYCDRDKPDVSEEHVLPQALGGALQPTNPFKLDVCTECNSTCGRWVDGPFIRSWPLYNARSIAGRIFVDPARGPVIPLVYMGKSLEWTSDDLECDFWLGPTGDQVYHFHKAYPGEPSYVGRPPVRPAALDPGVVFFALVATNPAWHSIIVASIRSAFAKDVMWYCLNGAPPGQRPPHPEVKPEHVTYLDWIRALPEDKMREVRMSISLGFEDRFMAKFAVGLGSVVLGEAYRASPDASLMRQAMWTRERSDRGLLKIRGQGILAGTQAFSSALDWKGCHVIMFIPSGDKLVLVANFYGQYSTTIVVCSDPTIWQGKVPDDGMLWVVAPGLGRFAGPMSLEQYLVGRLDPASGPLAELNTYIQAAPALPFVHLEPSPGKSSA